MNEVVNFGGNIRFTPRNHYAPRTEADLLAILDHHAQGTVRVVGSRHSWNPGIATPDALIEMKHFQSVHIESTGTESAVIVGGGCPLKHLLKELHERSNLTLPSIGLIAEQTVAGAISTGTHGSGRNSLSHYVVGLRIAAFDENGRAKMVDWNEGDPELRAARCALGCFGVIVAVKFQCVPQYDVEEVMVPCESLPDVLAGESRYPLQQFYLLPHRWTFFAQRRAATPAPQPRHWTAALFRLWWFVGIDLGLHLIIKLHVSVLRSPRNIRRFFRHMLPRLILKNRTIVDRSDRMLLMRHELFRHLEIELFVPERCLHDAVKFVRAVVAHFAGTEKLPDEFETEFQNLGLASGLKPTFGSFTFHYPITFRKVLPDDALLSPSWGPEPRYAISFITYSEPREPFLKLADVLAKSMARLFEARPHWGKFFPLQGEEISRLYPALPAFRAACIRVDPHGVFRNPFLREVLQFEPGKPAQTAG